MKVAWILSTAEQARGTWHLPHICQQVLIKEQAALHSAVLAVGFACHHAHPPALPPAGWHQPVVSQVCMYWSLGTPSRALRAGSDWHCCRLSIQHADLAFSTLSLHFIGFEWQRGVPSCQDAVDLGDRPPSRHPDLKSKP